MGPTLVASSPFLGALRRRGIGYSPPICYTAYITYIADWWPIPPSLQAIRRRLGQAQEQLAERLGVSFATAYRWKGDVTTPQGVARTVITPLAAKKFGGNTR